MEVTRAKFEREYELMLISVRASNSVNHAPLHTIHLNDPFMKHFFFENQSIEQNKICDEQKLTHHLIWNTSSFDLVGEKLCYGL